MRARSLQVTGNAAQDASALQALLDAFGVRQLGIRWPVQAPTAWPEVA
jgi:hypothetical protein